MATPRPSFYAVPSGHKVAAGRTRYPNAILDLIAAAPPLSWIQANTNTFQSVFPIPDMTPLLGSGVGSQNAIIACWSGFAWDSSRSRLAIFGGGHANYAGNDVFIFDMFTRQWKLGFYPTEVKNSAAGFETVDGTLKTPMSSHTYGNNNYLPLLDKFITFGGAMQSSGGAFVVTDPTGASVLRSLPGGYTCDLSLAGQGFVGGISGTNVKRGTAAAVSLPGAHAWYARDYLLDHAEKAGLALQLIFHINGRTAVVQEGGVDVIYINASGGGTSPSLFRIAYHDADNYLTDQITQVGRFWDNPGTDAGGDFDPVKKCFAYVGDATHAFAFWDLNFAGSSNQNKLVPVTGLTGSGVTEFTSLSTYQDLGMLYDSNRARFVCWGRGGAVYAITVPDGSPIPTTGWNVVKIADPTSPRPMTVAELGVHCDTGVHGKWKFAKDLDAYVGLQHDTQGDVWVFKPENWIDPRTIS